MNAIMMRLRLALAHQQLFDEGIEAARNACVGGASIAAAATVAAAYCDSPLVGAPALRDCMQRLDAMPMVVEDWVAAFRCHPQAGTGKPIYAAGFGYASADQAALLRRICRRLLHQQQRTGSGARSVFYLQHHSLLTEHCGPLNRVGLMALVFVDQGCTLDDAERHFTVWNIERAIVEAQKTRRAGLSQFPFLSEIHRYEGPWPDCASASTNDYLRMIGLE
jgi:hypothetical protein